jgi:HSP20 family protein
MYLLIRYQQKRVSMARRDDEYNPFRSMRQMHDMIDSLFDDMFTPGLNSSGLSLGSFRQPVTDVWENEKEVVVTIEMPGVDKNDIRLDIRGKTMTVKVERNDESSIQKEGMGSRSRSYKGFYTQFELPSEVIADKADATYNNGVLEVKIPKTESGKGKKIKVK